MSDTSFSLKDALFNEAKVSLIASEIKAVYPQFDRDAFVQQVVGKFKELELKERIYWIRESLWQFLPADYRQAVSILIKSLPPESDPTKTDNDFGDFIYAPYADFVARYGCSSEHLGFSFGALKEITTRFSAEDAIRYFINAFSDQTLRELQEWSLDRHYHVRRLASEGTRPTLPWAQRLNIPPERALPILDNLFSDKTRFVTRSIANHLNDISKIDPELTLRTLAKWQQAQKQDPREMEYITKHALRTLIKQGHRGAMEFLAFSADPEVSISDARIVNSPVLIGEYVEFEFMLAAGRDERLIVDYAIYFQSKSGSSTNKKVFKLRQLEVRKDQQVVIRKRHRLMRNMTTRKLYPGKHAIEIQVNGKKLAWLEFELSDTRT